jgi:hypothetical protein
MAGLATDPTLVCKTSLKARCASFVTKHHSRTTELLVRRMAKAGVIIEISAVNQPRLPLGVWPTEPRD